MNITMGIDKVLHDHAQWLRNTAGGVRAHLSNVDLSGANMRYAHLSRAKLYNANLSGANLSRADLSRADLSRADLSGVDLSGADLSGAKLSDVDLSGVNAHGATFDFSSWPLHCGTFNVQADPEVVEAMHHIRCMDASSWFDTYRHDLPQTPKE